MAGGGGGGEIGSIKETVTRDPFEENFVFCGSGTRRYKNNAKSELSHEILFYDASAPISSRLFPMTLISSRLFPMTLRQCVNFFQQMDPDLQ